MSREKVCTCQLTRHVHGTPASFTVCKCRCMPCRVSYARAVQRRRSGVFVARSMPFIPTVGTRRRIEALHAIGWSGGYIAERLGVSYQNVHHLRTKDNPIFPTTAERVAALYDELWDKTPTGSQVGKTINWARRSGFAPPLAWDDESIDDPAAEPALDAADSEDLDEIAVERFMSGTLRDPHSHVSLERVEAVRRLAEMGMSDCDIGQRVGMTGNNVQWFRRRRGIPAGAGGGGVAA